MAITPPGADELTQLRRLVGSSPGLVTPELAFPQPAQPLPKMMQQPEPVEPSMVPKLAQAFPETDYVPPADPLAHLTPEELEQKLWQAFGVPEDMVPTVIQYARSHNITPNDLARRGHDWKAILPQDVLVQYEEQKQDEETALLDQMATETAPPVYRGALTPEAKMMEAVTTFDRPPEAPGVLELSASERQALAGDVLAEEPPAPDGHVPGTGETLEVDESLLTEDQRATRHQERLAKELERFTTTREELEPSYAGDVREALEGALTDAAGAQDTALDKLGSTLRRSLVDPSYESDIEVGQEIEKDVVPELAERERQVTERETLEAEAGRLEEEIAGPLGGALRGKAHRERLERDPAVGGRLAFLHKMIAGEIPQLENQMQVSYDVMQHRLTFAADADDRRKIIAEFPKLDPDDPTSVQNAALESAMDRVEPDVRRLLGKLRRSDKHEHRLRYYRILGLAGEDDIQLDITRDEDGQPRIGLQLPEEMRDEWWAPKPGETEEEKVARVEEIQRFLARRAWLELHKEDIVRKDHIFMGLRGSDLPQPIRSDKAGYLAKSVIVDKMIHGYAEPHVVKAMEDAGYSREAVIKEVSDALQGISVSRVRSVVDFKPTRGHMRLEVRGQRGEMYEPHEEGGTDGAIRREFETRNAHAVYKAAKLLQKRLSFDNVEDSIGRTNSNWMPEEILRNPAGVDDQNIVDNYENYVSRSGVTLTGEEAQAAMEIESGIYYTKARRENIDLLDIQTRGPNAVVEIMTGNWLGHMKSRIPKEIQEKFAMRKAALFNQPFMMPFEQGAPLLMSLYGISNKDILTPTTEQAKLRSRLLRSYAFVHARAQPADVTNQNLHQYRNEIEEEEKRSLTLSQVIKRWEINRPKYEAKARQILMEGFIPQGDRIGLGSQIDIDPSRQWRLVNNYFRGSELISLEMFLMLPPHLRWVNKRGQRRIPVQREFLEYLKPQTQNYMEDRRHKHFVGYNLAEVMGTPWRGGIGTTVVFNHPVTEATTRAATEGFGNNGLVDFTDAQQWKEANMHVDSVIKALAHDKDVTYNHNNIQDLISISSRYIRAQSNDVFGDWIELMEGENQPAGYWSDMFWIHLPFSFKNILHGAWTFGKGVLGTGKDITEMTVGTAFAALSGPQPGEKTYEDYYERVALPNGQVVWQAKTDASGKPLMDPKRAMESRVTDYTLHRSWEEVRDRGFHSLHTTLTQTIPMAVEEIGKFYVNAFSSWDSFKGYAQTDPLGAGLDGLFLLGAISKIALPGTLTKTTRLDQSKLLAKRKQRLGKTLTPEELEILDPDWARKFEERQTETIFKAEFPEAVPIKAASERVVHGPLQRKTGQAVGNMRSHLQHMAAPADWIPIFQWPQRFIHTISDVEFDGRVVRVLAKTGDATDLKYRPTFIVLGNTLGLVDSKVPIIGGLIKTMGKYMVNEAAAGTRKGMIASYFMNQEAYMGRQLRMIVTAGEQDVNLLKLKSLQQNMDMINAAARRTVDAKRAPKIEEILKSVAEDAVDDTFGKPGTVRVQLHGTNIHTRVSLDVIKDYMLEHWDEFNKVLDDLWQGKEVAPDAFLIPYKGGQLNLADLGFVTRTNHGWQKFLLRRGARWSKDLPKWKPSAELFKFVEKEGLKARALLERLMELTAVRDTRFSESAAAISTSVNTLHKVVNGARVPVHVLESDFIRLMDSPQLRDAAIEVIAEIARSGHLDEFMNNPGGATLFYLRVADVENTSAGGIVAKHYDGTVSGHIDEVAPRDPIYRVHSDVLPTTIPKNKRPLQIVKEGDAYVVHIDEERFLGLWDKENTKIQQGHESVHHAHGPIKGVTFQSPGEYLDFLHELGRVRAVKRKKPKQSAVDYREETTKLALERFIEKRSGLKDHGISDVGIMTDADGTPIKFEVFEEGEVVATRTGARGGQVVGFTLEDLGMVRRQGKHWLPGDSLKPILDNWVEETRILHPGSGVVKSVASLSELVTHMGRLLEDGKRGLFTVHRGLVLEAKNLQATLESVQRTLKGDRRGAIALSHEQGMSFARMVDGMGLKAAFATTEADVAKVIKGLFGKGNVAVKVTRDMVRDSLESVRSDKPVMVFYKAKRGPDGKVIRDSGGRVVAGDEKITLADIRARLQSKKLKQARKNLGINPKAFLERLEKMSSDGRVLDAYDFTDHALGRIAAGASNDSKHLATVMEHLGTTLGENTDQLRLLRERGQKFSRELEVARKISRETTLERMKNNPLSAVRVAITSMERESQMAFLTWLKSGEVPEIALKNPKIFKAWEKSGLVDLVDGKPQMSQLGALSTMFVIDHTNHFYQSMFTRAVLYNSQYFSGPAMKFFNVRQYLPPELAQLAELLTEGLSDVQAGMALDWAKHINELGFAKSPAASRNMLTHWSRVYEGLYERYIMAGDPIEAIEKTVTHTAKIKNLSDQEMNNLQANRLRNVLARLTHYEAANFARTGLRHNMHRVRAIKFLVDDGRIKAGVVTGQGKYVAPGPEGEWVKLDLSDIQMSRQIRGLGDIDVGRPGAIKKTYGWVRDRYANVLDDVDELDASFSKLSADEKKLSLHYVMGDLAEMSDGLYIRRTDAAMLNLEDRAASRWAQQVWSEKSDFAVAPNLADKAAAVAIDTLEGVYQFADAVAKHPITRVFKIRKLMLSALGPQSRNMMTNVLLTAQLHPGAISHASWWKYFNEYWTNYRNGVRPTGAKGAFMDEVSKLEIVQSGIGSEIGFRDYTRLNVAVDSWLSGLKKNMESYSDYLRAGEELLTSELVNAHNAKVAVSLGHDMTLTHRKLFLKGLLDDGELLKAAERAAPTKLANVPKRGIIKQMLDSKLGRGTKQVQEAFAPLPFQGMSADNAFLRFGKNSFNHTDDAFKYAFAGYLYDVMGLRGTALRDELFKFWPDYQNIADAERMYTLYNAFGVYQTKYYRILTQWMIDNPGTADLLSTFNQVAMANELSDPETYGWWQNLPAWKKYDTSRFPFGMLDESMFSVMNAERFEVQAFNNPVMQIFLSIAGAGESLFKNGIPRESSDWKAAFSELLQTWTDIAYGSVQLNPLELAWNTFLHATDVGDISDIDVGYGNSPMDFHDSLSAALADSGGPRWNKLMAGALGEANPLGTDKSPPNFANALTHSLFGMQTLDPDRDTSARAALRQIGKLREIERQEGGLGQRFAAKAVAQGVTRTPTPSVQQRILRDINLRQLEALISNHDLREALGLNRPGMLERLIMARNIYRRKLERGLIAPPAEHVGPGSGAARQDLYHRERLRRESKDQRERSKSFQDFLKIMQERQQQ